MRPTVGQQRLAGGEIGGQLRIDDCGDGRQVGMRLAARHIEGIGDLLVEAVEMGLRHQLGVHLLGEVMPGALELDRRIGHRVGPQRADERLGQEVLDGDELARVDHAAARVGVHAIGPGPAEQDLLEQDIAAGAIVLLHVCPHQLLQAGIPRHRLAQVVDVPGAAHLRQCSHVGTHRNGGFRDADGGVSRQQVLADGPAGAVAAREGCPRAAGYSPVRRWRRWR